MTVSLAHRKQIAQFRQRCKEVCASGNSSQPQYPVRTSRNTVCHERGTAYANILGIVDTYLCIFRNILIVRVALHSILLTFSALYLSKDKFQIFSKLFHVIINTLSSQNFKCFCEKIQFN